MNFEPLPKLIVLNGASSSGKTLTAQAIVDLNNHKFMTTGWDDILERIQPFGAEQGMTTATKLHRAVRVFHFHLTHSRLRLFEQLHQEIVEHVQAGRHIVVDTSLMEEEVLFDAARRFAPLQGFLIGMKPPLDVSEQWEAKRTDRSQGQARKHYHAIHAHKTYDLVIDPSVMTPEQCATTILQFASKNKATAFQLLAQQQS